MNTSRPSFGGWAAALACLLLTGCAVGPNFTAPAAPHLDRYGLGPGREAQTAAGVAEAIELGASTDPHWWRLFGSPALDDLVSAGLKDSPSLASAREALAQSRDQARAGAGVFLPSVGVSAAAARERTTPTVLGQSGQPRTFSLYTITGEVSYALDVFGGERRNVEALNAQSDYQRHAVGAAFLLLTGQIVDTAIARAGYVAQAETLADIIRVDTAQRDILTAEYQAGHGSMSQVLAAEQQLQSDRQDLDQVQQRAAASAVLLKTLVGHEPAETSPSPPDLSDLKVPVATPVSLPSQLVRRRPDILEAEASLQQASAQVGVATAAMYPSISLTGDYGATSLSLASLASPMGRFWNVGPTIDIPIFRGGELWYGRKAAQAAYLKAASDYRQTVLAALGQVADAVRAIDSDADALRSSRTAFEAAALSERLADANRQAGVIADFDAMSAQAQSDRARLALIAAKAQRLQDTVALYVACGGGWTGEEPGSGAAASSSQ